MSSILLISITVRLVAMVWSFVLMWRLREWRMGFLTVMLSFMASRQVLTLVSLGASRPGLETVSQASEFPGLIVSFMALAAIHSLQRVFENRRRNEEKRLELEAQLQHAQRLESLGVLAGGIAHDFNNLLTPVLVHASCLRESLKDNDLSQERLASIESAATHAADLCHQMLAFSGRGRFNLQAIDLSELVEDIGRLLDVGIAVSVDVKQNLASDLPPILADSRQMQQVVMNLITNASDATRESGGTLTIETGVWNATRAYLAASCVNDNLPDGEYVFLQVSDTGCGMDEQTIRHVFDPFFTTRKQGCGLGMAAVLGIVRGHRGAIRIDSRPGQGTTIRVLFPTHEADVAIRAEKRPAPTLQGSGLVLIADDDPAIRSAAESVLTGAGFSVLLASDGQEALEMIEAHEDDLQFVLLDMTMPRVSGLEVCSRLKEKRCFVPIILSSGFDEEDASSVFANGDAPEFIHKPYRAEELLEKAQQLLRYAGPQSLTFPSPETSVRRSTGRQAAVLVVDDQQIIRSSLCMLIEALGYDPIEAETGNEALAICESRSSDIGLVLLDQHMPGLSGEETLLKLSKSHAHLPVALCSGSGGDDLQPATRDLLAGILTKPLQQGDLQSLLAEHLSAAG